MSGLRRIAVVIVVAAAVIIWGASFEVSDVQRRSIVLGLGVDFDDEKNKFVLTAEVVSPGNGSEQVGVFSKIVDSEGHSVGEAIAEIGVKTGKQPSLGQCGVLVLGRNLFEKRDFSDVLEYFVRSDSFKENAVICCTDSTADLFDKIDALNKSVSLSLAEALNENSKKVAIPSNTLLEYARSQSELNKDGYLNVVSFVDSPNKDESAPDKKSGYFVYDKMAVFSQNKFVIELSEQEIAGFASLTEDVVGDTVSVSEDNKTYALRVNTKSVDSRLDGNTVKIKISLQVKLARADGSDVGGLFAAKSDRDVSEAMLEQMKQKVCQNIRLFVERQAECNFDIVDFHELFRRRDGYSDELASMPASDIAVEVSLDVTEK